MGKVFDYRGGIMAVLILCIIVPELLAQIPRRPLTRTLPARLAPRSRQVSRSFVPMQRSRLPPRSRVSNSWPEIRPRLSEVSVPAVQRSSLTTRGVTRTAVNQRRRGGDFRAFQREVNPTRLARRLRRLPPFARRRFSTAPRSLQVGRILPRLSRINNNNNNNNNVDINYYTSNVNLRRGGPPPVRVRSPARVSDTARRPVVVRTRPQLRPLPAVTVRSSPSHDAPKVFSRRKLRGLSGGISRPIQGRTNSVVVQRRVSTRSGGARVPTVEQSRRNVSPVLHVTHAGIHTGINTKTLLTPSSQRILEVPAVKIETAPSTKLDRALTKQIDIIPSTKIEIVRLKTKDVLPSPKVVRVPPPVSGNVPILTQLNDAGKQPNPSVGISQTQKTPTDDPFQRELVDVFTQVLEGYLAPQGTTLEQPASPAAVPIAPPATIHVQQPISQSGGPYSQYNPYNPYNNPYGQMTSFGYMNPWMSPAMMQEMWYGDTQDPPDGVTTTSAPDNTTAMNNTAEGTLTALNSTADVTLAHEALGTEVINPIARVIKSKGPVETTTETMPVEIVTNPTNVKVRTTQDALISVSTDTTVSGVPVEGKDTKPLVAINTNTQVKVIVKTDSITSDISEKIQDGVSSALDTASKKSTSVPDSNQPSAESIPDTKAKSKDKPLKGSEQLLVDIATLIRKSKVDIAHFSKMISDHTVHRHSSHEKRKPTVSQGSRLSKEHNEPAVGESTQISNDPSKLVVEALPTAEQLGIILPEYVVPTTPVTKRPEILVTKHPEILVTKRPIISVTKRPKIPVTKHQEILVADRPSISVTKRPGNPETKHQEILVTNRPSISVTKRPGNSETKHQDILVTNRPSISVTKRPENLETKHQEILVTNRPSISVTKRQENPETKHQDIIVTTRPVIPVTIPPRSAPTLPTLPFNPPTTPSSSIPKGLVFTRQPDMYRTLSTILIHNPDAVKKAFTTDPTPPISSQTNGSHPPVKWERRTNEVQSATEVMANEVIWAPEAVLVDKTTNVLSAVMDGNDNMSGLALLDKAADTGVNTTNDRKDAYIDMLSGSPESKSTNELVTNVSDQFNDNSSTLSKDRFVTVIENGSELPTSIKMNGSKLIPPILVNRSTLIPPNMINGSTPIPLNEEHGSTLAPSSLGPSDIPVLANVVVEDVKTEGITEKVADTANITGSSHSLQEQLENITSASGVPGAVDLSNYLSDPSFLNILRQALLKLTQPYANATTAGNSSTHSETTTSIPEMLSTTSATMTTTEEYELEDYLPEVTTTFEPPTTSESKTMTSTMTSNKVA